MMERGISKDKSQHWLQGENNLNIKANFIWKIHLGLHIKISYNKYF